MRYSRKIIRHGSHRAHTNCHISPIPQIAPSINPSLDSDCTTVITDLCADSQLPIDMGDTVGDRYLRDAISGHV